MPVFSLGGARVHGFSTNYKRCGIYLTVNHSLQEATLAEIMVISCTAMGYTGVSLRYRNYKDFEAGTRLHAL